ncbi:MAG TPA: hypothetical protein VGM06_13125 [Polyangiaceae bacterium]
MKEARSSTTLVDAFESGDESKPGTTRAPAVASGKPVAAQARVPARSSPSTPPAAEREPSARMRCWCSEE